MAKIFHILFLMSLPCTTILAGTDRAVLRLVLELDRDTYAPCEPIALRYWVENASEAEVAVPGLIDADYGWIRFEIAGEDGEFRPYHTGEQASGVMRSVILKRGERLSSRMVIVTNLYGRAARTNLQFADTKLFPFSEPGKYRIRATYPIVGPDGNRSAAPLNSNVVEFAVRKPSEIEEEALAFFKSPDDLAAAMGADGGVPDLPAALRRWEEFVGRYPTSVYAPAVQLHLGRLHLNGTGMLQPDPARAEVHLEAAAQSGREGLADDALLDLAKSQVELGRFDEARASLARLLELFPDSERKAEAIRVRDGLAKGWRTLRDIYRD